LLESKAHDPGAWSLLKEIAVVLAENAQVAAPAVSGLVMALAHYDRNLDVAIVDSIVKVAELHRSEVLNVLAMCLDGAPRGWAASRSGALVVVAKLGTNAERLIPKIAEQVLSYWGSDRKVAGIEALVRVDPELESEETRRALLHTLEDPRSLPARIEALRSIIDILHTRTSKGRPLEDEGLAEMFQRAEVSMMREGKELLRTSYEAYETKLERIRGEK